MGIPTQRFLASVAKNQETATTVESGELEALASRELAAGHTVASVLARLNAIKKGSRNLIHDRHYL